jgi:hypothetical protein
MEPGRYRISDCAYRIDLQADNRSFGIQRRSYRKPRAADAYQALKMLLTRSLARPKPAPIPRPDITLLMNPPPLPA